MTSVVISPVPVQAETPDEWIALGQRIHGGFGSYLAVGIRIGLDARTRLGATPRELDVTYHTGKDAPCPCMVDGIMIATVASPGQNTLRVVFDQGGSTLFGVAIIRHRKTGETLRYSVPASTRLRLDEWNEAHNERGRYAAVMAAPQDFLFQVELQSSKSIGE
ncbi:formylmethanofuran dehydrogenase subunit E family protein [Pantanalinema rosaneae CENA516]|jgi:formylmethanofuran dehydrogenase subunit E|uniref:formylmethanofuran dehydrogenase subunit E family protein n=1 Tax=Pantanalinema rosaneae TaxID=1620701 RepID=UPI003D6F4115